VMVFGYLALISIDFHPFCFWFLVFAFWSLVLVSVEEIYQTLETVFEHVSKHLEVNQIYSTIHYTFDSLLLF